MADRYGLALSTTSAAARDAYVDGVDRLLAAQPGADAAFARAIKADPQFALAHAGLARVHQAYSRPPEARASMDRALALAEGLSAREQSHLAGLAKVIAGDGTAALAAIRVHLAHWPRDAMLLAPCTGVFGLIGFCGRAGREQELAQMLDALAPAYGDDWWFLAAHAFALGEVGRVVEAQALIARSLAANPRNANGAHIRTHVDYEAGEGTAALTWLEQWFAPYEQAAQMHCHLGWHVALWNLDLGNEAAAWAAYEAHVAPGAAWGPAINVLSDSAAFLFRAELAGARRDAARWQTIADYARRNFSKPGLAFADAHAALAFAMAGHTDALATLRHGAAGPAGDVVAGLAQGFGAYARGDWPAAMDTLGTLVPVHERIGGSRAQRDLIEYAWLSAARHAGRQVTRERARALPAPLSHLLA